MNDCNVELVIERIKERKKQLGITNEQLAAKSGISFGTLNKILGSETKDPSISNIIKLKNALGLSQDYLFGTSESDAQTFTEDEQELISDFRKLNAEGKAAAVGAVKAFTLLDQYKKSGQNELAV